MTTPLEIGPTRSGHIENPIAQRNYRRMLFLSVSMASVVAIVPLVIMTAVNYQQYEEAFHAEAIGQVSSLATNAKLSVESFLSERLSALSLVVRAEPQSDLQDPVKLRRLLMQMKNAFGGFIDLGVIDSDGQQVSYAGPYELEGKNYAEQGWFHDVALRGLHISDVFLGHRHVPHFIIAVNHDTNDGQSFVLRATIDTDALLRQVKSLSVQPRSDAFIINHQGILQTPSRFYGDTLEELALPVPRESPRPEVFETRDEIGNPLIIGYAYIERSPFILMLLSQPGAQQESWLSLRQNLVLFLVISILLIIGVVLWGSFYMVNRTKQSDLRRAALFHKMEYTNKMAAIGRLAAGVAHEINNPLAIINEKAGLLKDLLTLTETVPPKERLLKQVDSVINSVERCGDITHRLLGFAKHMDVQREGIDLDLLIKGVLGFLEKEASYRNLAIQFDIEPDLPTIESDRGQLQQVFLNIINNAFAAVDKGGVIRIAIARVGASDVSVSVSDNGKGISTENLERIFEPFFTTKGSAGTGLGLSITYGIVQKLGGRINVSSKIGEGTSFTVILPIRRE